jgi:hypothetical protein
VERKGSPEKHRLKLKLPKDPGRKWSVNRSTRSNRPGVIAKVDGMLTEPSIGISRTRSLVHLSNLDAEFLDIVSLDTVFLLPNRPFGKLQTASNGINPHDCLTR